MRGREGQESGGVGNPGRDHHVAYTVKYPLAALALVLTLGVASAAPRKPLYTYKLRPTHIEAGTQGLASCGNAKRFKRETWTVRVWTFDHITVNGTPWRIDHEALDNGPPLGELRLVFKANPEAFTFLVLDIYTNRDGAIGKFYLVGMLPNREACADVVRVEGPIL